MCNETKLIKVYKSVYIYICGDREREIKISHKNMTKHQPFRRLKLALEYPNDNRKCH